MSEPNYSPTREQVETYLQASNPNAEVIAAGHGLTQICAGRRLQCDFCSALDPSHELPADDVVVGFDRVVGQSVSVGAWAACATCNGYIAAGDRDRLLLRAILSFSAAHPNVGVDAMVVIAPKLRATHDGFFAARAAFAKRSSRL